VLWKDLRDSLINGEVCKDILKQRNSVSQLSSVNRIVAYTNLGATLLYQHYLSARFRVRRPCQILSIQIQIILSASPSIAGIRQNRYQNRQLAGQTCCTNIGRMSEVERRQHVARSAPSTRLSTIRGLETSNFSRTPTALRVASDNHCQSYENLPVGFVRLQLCIMCENLTAHLGNICREWCLVACSIAYWVSSGCESSRDCWAIM